MDDSKVYCPLANLYLKSYVNMHLPHIEVELGDDEYDVNNLDSLERYDAIGISIMTPQRQEALALARAIKSRWPKVTTIAGGPHVKYYCSQLASEGAFDYLVPLDGERALATILSARAAAGVVSDSLTKAEVLAQPRPDRTSISAITLLRRYSYKLGGREATTCLTARGCPEQCAFCEDAMTQVRWSSMESITGQLADIAQLGYRAVYIFDDLFAMSLAKIRPICRELQRLDLRYRCNAQARYFTKWGDEMARLLAETGCYEIAFGAESGSQKILDNVRKRCTVEQNYLTVEYAKRYGLVVKAFILIGLPGETWETLAETEKFIATASFDDFQCVIYMPFRGTQIRNSIDQGEPIDLTITTVEPDGEVSGAYGVRGGNTSSAVRTAALSTEDLKRFRDYLVTRYRPYSHRLKWLDQDAFFDVAHL